MNCDFNNLLSAAWARVKPQLLADPAELGRRLARRSCATLRRPPRAWCLAVRASDHRLDRALCQDPHDPDHPSEFRPHDAMLTKPLLCDLCMPVTILKPGEVWDDVARKLGVSPGTLLTARLNGVLRARYVPHLGGRPGKPVPILSCDHALDPCSRGFRPADPFWDWTTEYLPHRLPNDFEQTLTRVPSYRPTISARRFKHDPLSEAGELLPPKRSKRLPPPPPDFAWYKWKGDEYVGCDWRNPYTVANYQKYQQKLAKQRGWSLRHYYNKRTAEGSRSGGSLKFSGWKWRCPTCAGPSKPSSARSRR